MPKVSIITPLYNGAKTLQDTIESVLSQDYNDWEWILFDDGSTDSSREIGKKLSSDHPGKIFYYEHSANNNCGTAYTRNRAIERSSGELISFIDQDDIWYKNRLSHQLNILETLKDCAMIWGPALYWYKERSFKQPVNYNGKEIDSRSYDSPELIKIFLSDLRATPLPSASLIVRNYFDEVKGFEEEIKGSEDIVLWLKLAIRFKIYYDDEMLVKYRRHQDSTLRQAKESGIMNEWNLVFIRWVIDFLRKNKDTSGLIENYEFKYYTCLKKTALKKNYFESRRDVLKGLKSNPELREKFSKDFFLDLIMPFSLATRVSAKLRFDLFKKNGKS
ncbi:MAG: glycosyltransferase family A protein [bacterium]